MIISLLYILIYKSSIHKFFLYRYYNSHTCNFKPKGLAFYKFVYLFECLILFTYTKYRYCYTKTNPKAYAKPAYKNIVLKLCGKKCRHSYRFFFLTGLTCINNTKPCKYKYYCGKRIEYHSIAKVNHR